MNRLLKTQLKKAYGKDFSIDNSSDEFKRFLELLSQSYDDFYVERQMLEHTLEINSQELTEAHQEVLQNHELLHSVTESMDDAIFYKDLNKKYIGGNWHFSNLVGLPIEGIIGKSDYDLFNKEDADHSHDIDNQLLEHGGPLALKEWLSDAKGTKHYFSTIKSPLLNSKSETIGIVGVSRDITQQYEMQKELEAKQLLLIQQGRHASMGEMIGNIAHQWRQPLNALGLLIQKMGYLYSRGTLNEENINANIDKGMNLINGMSKTIDDFREFFNPNKKKELFNIREAIENAHAIVESTFASHEIEYQLEMYDETPEIEGYKNEFSQVIVNLLNNAKDILIEKDVCPAYIKIFVIQADDKLAIKICDNGGGIPEAALTKIFDPYFSTKEEGKGTGIGLYMSKMIIEDHMNGKLTASNTSEGACFTIEL
jgi:PAS domain S-box-containing protein